MMTYSNVVISQPDTTQEMVKQMIPMNIERVATGMNPRGRWNHHLREELSNPKNPLLQASQMMLELRGFEQNCSRKICFRGGRATSNSFTLFGVIGEVNLKLQILDHAADVNLQRLYLSLLGRCSWREPYPWILDSFNLLHGVRVG